MPILKRFISSRHTFSSENVSQSRHPCRFQLKLSIEVYIISFLCTLHTRQTAKRRGRDGPAEGLQGGVLGSDCQWETGRLGVHVALRPSQKHRVETGVVRDVVIPTRTET